MFLVLILSLFLSAAVCQAQDETKICKCFSRHVAVAEPLLVRHSVIYFQTFFLFCLACGMF